MFPIFLFKYFLLQECDVLDLFGYALEQEEFENKWKAVTWAQRIYNQVEASQQMLVDETEKFYKMQQADEGDFWDKLDWCAAQFANLAQASDVTKVHETAIDAKRIWKAMKDNQEVGQLLNQRQRLFGVPVTSFDALFKLIKEFTPYKDVWVTGSGESIFFFRFSRLYVKKNIN